MPNTRPPITIYDRYESDTVKGQLDIRAHAGASDLEGAYKLAAFAARDRSTDMMVCMGMATLALFNGRESGERLFYTEPAANGEAGPILILVSAKGDRGYHYFRGAKTLAEALEKAVEISRSDAYYGKEVVVFIERHKRTMGFANGVRQFVKPGELDNVSGEPLVPKNVSIRDEVIAYLKENLSISVSTDERTESSVIVLVGLSLDGEEFTKAYDYLYLDNR